MEPQYKAKAHTALLLPTILILFGSLQLHAASISEELLKTKSTDTEQSTAKPSEAQSVKLIVSPKQCVAMQQGQRCYVQVSIDFKANYSDDYCLYLSTQQTALKCWQQATQGQLSYAFDSKVDIEFSIKTPITEKAQANALATTKVKMAWVHEKKGKPRMSWRLF